MVDNGAGIHVCTLKIAEVRGEDLTSFFLYQSVFKMVGKGSRARGFPGARAGAVDVELQEQAI